jgi:hypothetical protein
MKVPTCIKDVQKLIGCMEALNRFISKLGERGLPFFKLLKHQEKFAWTPEADQALAPLKGFLSKPPVLMAPRKKEQLLLYLDATTRVVSTAIIVERQEDDHAYPVQRPVYFVSEVLLESKACYQLVKKLLYVEAQHLAEATTLLPQVLDLWLCLSYAYGVSYLFLCVNCGMVYNYTY